MKPANNNVKEVLMFLDGLKIDNLRILDFISEEDITENLTFDKLTELIERNSGFNVEIIYYSVAIDFLKKNDPSLMDSLEFASELGYDLKDINSETLASILASNMLRSNWYELEDEITDFLKSLSWD